MWSKGTQQGICAARDSFITDVFFDSEKVKSYVLRSWEISHENEIDPEAPLTARILDDDEFTKLSCEYELLLAAAEPVLEMVEISIRGTGFIATLAVAPGIIIKVLGDASVMTQAQKRFNVPGAVRSVEEVGGSALTMSMIEGAPVQITGCEHYSKHFHEWTCSSAPIHDEREGVVGSLTVSGLMPNSQRHTLALVASAAATISTRLRESTLMHSQQRLSSMLTSVYNSLSDGVVAVDKNLEITHVNTNAAQMLGVREGELIEKIIHPEERKTVRSMLERGVKDSVTIRFIGKKGTQQCLCRLLPTSLPDGETVGTTITLTEHSQLVNIVRHVGGNYAKYTFDDIKGKNLVMRHQLSLAKQAARTNSRILLFGESGTGKELFAQAIHNGSLRRNGPFVAISCAAIPRDLIESELFGYVGGAFTGARRRGMVGKFELAQNGTLFLDEINSLPLDMQAKLLRVLQQKEIVRIGDSKPTFVNARVIAATNVDLLSAVKKGNFREDLYYRLNVVEVVIPPLRERRNDIRILAHHILSRQSNEAGFQSPNITNEALALLRGYDWPGNVRELDNACERALLVSGGTNIQKKHLPDNIVQNFAYESPTSTGSLNTTYKKLIEQSVSLHNGNLSQVARDLGIARTTLYRNMRKFGLLE